MSEILFDQYGDKKILAERAKKDVNGNSLELTVTDNKITAIGGKSIDAGTSGGSELPAITADDNGKVLTVLDGNLAWTPGGEGEIPSAAAANTGDVLTADGQGSYGWSAPTGGGGGSGLPVYSAADAYKVLAVNETGTGVEWKDISTELTINLGNYISVMTGEGGEPSVDVSTSHHKIFDALCDNKKVYIKGTMYGGEVMLQGYLDDFSIGGNYTLADLWEMYQGYGLTKDEVYNDFVEQLYESDPEMVTFTAYLKNIAYGIEIKIEITPDGHYVSPKAIVKLSDETGRICLEMAYGGNPANFAIAPNGMEGAEWNESLQSFAKDNTYINKHMAYVMDHDRAFEFGVKLRLHYGGFIKVGTMPDPEHPEYTWATAEYIMMDAPVNIVLSNDNETLTMTYDGVAYENDDTYNRIDNYRSNIGSEVTIQYSSVWTFNSEYHGFFLDSEQVTVVS